MGFKCWPDVPTADDEPEPDDEPEAADPLPVTALPDDNFGAW